MVCTGGLGSLTDRGILAGHRGLGCVQTTGRAWAVCRPAASPSRAQSPAGSWSLLFPGFNRKKKKKEEKGRWPWGVGQAGALEPSRLSCLSEPCTQGVHGLGDPVCSGLLGFLFSQACPGLSSPVLRQWPRSVGYRAAVLEKNPAVFCGGPALAPEGPQNLCSGLLG